MIIKGANPSELDSREQISNILNSTGRIPPIRAKSVNPFSTNTLVRSEVKRLEDVDYANLVLPHG
jgi:hypothetical protein